MFDFWKRKKPEDPWDQQTENHIAQPDNTPHFQMYVDEVFSISGRGTVVTGTIKAGTLRVNDRILIIGKSGRLATQVDGLEAFHKIMERAIIANRKHDKGEVRKEMSERKMKRVEDSLTEQSHLLMPKCLNAAGYLFGGQLLAWIDETAGIVAKRHAEMNVVTVAVDNMYFKAGARVNDTIVLIGRLTHVGRSSMEVRIDTYCEALDGTRTMINRAYFIMVGTDEHQHPVEVPGLIIEGVTQQIENEAAQKRAKLWKIRRQEGF